MGIASTSIVVRASELRNWPKSGIFLFAVVTYGQLNKPLRDPVFVHGVTLKHLVSKGEPLGHSLIDGNWKHVNITS